MPKKPLCEYEDAFHGIDFRAEPHRYRIGRGEQGVFMTKPYSTEIRDLWRFRTPIIAQESGSRIYQLFLRYLEQNDFVGADVARKFLMMGWSRSRRYANHSSGTKWENGVELPQDKGSEQSEKALSAAIFKTFYDAARTNPRYRALTEIHKKLYKTLNK